MSSSWDRIYSEVRQPQGYVMEYALPPFLRQALEPIYAEADAREEEAHGDLFRYNSERVREDQRSSE